MWTQIMKSKKLMIPAILIVGALIVGAAVLLATKNEEPGQIEAALVDPGSFEAISSLPETLNDPAGTEGEPTENRELDEIKKYIHANYDEFNIDGSTSMLPLHASLNVLYSVDSLYTAVKKTYLGHSKTVEALEMLIKGENDIVLSVDYSDELLAKAKQNGVDLVKKEITKEAFVFLINKNNPVKSLTISQLKDIYSGKITNWLEVGGDDAPIRAYQRNGDSGSQMRMLKFMGDTPLMQEAVEYISDMGWVIEQVADYDEGKYSIAYNMYTFTENQYENADIMLLAVNGVYPTDDSIFDETYPIIIYNYIYYDNNKGRASEFAENLYAYLMSDEGQRLISDSGYVNLREKNNIKKYTYRLYDRDNYGRDIGWYNKEKGEFYDLDYENGNQLIIYNNYPDYVLKDTPQYKDNAKLREFLTLIFASNYEVDALTFWIDEKANTISFMPWNDFSFDPYDLFCFKYENKNYKRFEYYIDEDRYVLTAATTEDYGYSAEDGYLDAFKNDIEFDSTREISKEDFKNLYIKASEYPGESREFEYLPLFK